MKTIEQFLKALRQTPRDWRIVEPGPGVVMPGSLRRGTTENGNYQCPLGAVAYPKQQAVIFAQDYGKFLGLSTKDTESIINAADTMGQYDPKLRLQLLEACGLTEGTQA